MNKFFLIYEIGLYETEFINLCTLYSIKWGFYDLNKNIVVKAYPVATKSVEALNVFLENGNIEFDCLNKGKYD